VSEAAPIRVVLAATDPVEERQRRVVCDAAAEVAALHGAEVHFLYAVPPVRFPAAGTEGLAQREALRYAGPRLDDLVERARGYGVDAAWSAREAAVDEAIRVEAGERGAGLVVVSPPRRWLPGRWLRELRRSVGVPVLCIPRSWNHARDLRAETRILVPVFRRERALRSVGSALRIFSPSSAARAGRGGQVRLVRPDEAGPAPGDVDAPAAPSVAEALDASAREGELTRLAGDLREVGIEADAALPREDDPVEAVGRQACDVGSDVIALEAPARKPSRLLAWPRRSFLGRLALRVSRPLLLS
jgi:hypothetical protein